jgi:lactoylglutathione lyase
MASSTDATFSHVGLCVSDLERSVRFYCDGLGFEPGEGYDLAGDFGRAAEVDGELSMSNLMIRRGGLTIELLTFETPSVTGAPSHSRNQLGLTHLSFSVDDIAALTARLVECGGTVLESTRVVATEPQAIEVVFLADPDGARVELMQYAT